MEKWRGRKKHPTCFIQVRQTSGKGSNIAARELWQTLHKTDAMSATQNPEQIRCSERLFRRVTLALKKEEILCVGV